MAYLRICKCNPEPVIIFYHAEDIFLRIGVPAGVKKKYPGGFINEKTNLIISKIHALIIPVCKQFSYKQKTSKGLQRRIFLNMFEHEISTLST
jgi:hypothetical protein